MTYYMTGHPAPTRRAVSPLLLTVTLFVFTGVLATGCSTIGPQGPYGLLYTNVRGPVAISDAPSGTQVGRASGRVLFGFTNAQAGIERARASAGISRIHHVDYEATMVLGLFGTYTVIVYGEGGGTATDATPEPTDALDVIMAPAQPPAPAPTPAPMLSVRDAQEQLNRLGFSCGTPDGRAGPRTRQCIEAFQRREGLTPTGRVDQATSDAIRRAIR